MTEFFVTGTDTGVGKTAIAAALLAATRRDGGRTFAFKPAESGCPRGPDGLRPADAETLSIASGNHQHLDDICPYRFADPIAPGVAAEREQIAIDFERIARLIQNAQRSAPQLLLVEGAGGLLVPYGQGRLAADLVHKLHLPLLIVAHSGLGTINHSLLTIEVARTRNLKIAAIILNDPRGDADPSLAHSNAREIERAANVPVLGPIPHNALATHAPHLITTLHSRSSPTTEIVARPGAQPGARAKPRPARVLPPRT